MFIIEQRERMAFPKAQNIRVCFPSVQNARVLELGWLRRFLSPSREGGDEEEEWFHDAKNGSRESLLFFPSAFCYFRRE